MRRHTLDGYALLLVATAGLVATDSNDWVNVQYVLSQAGASGSSDTAGARLSIVNSAGTSAKSGPWSIVTKATVIPPSGDAHDYLSWAPYHWPACNWCSKGSTHLSNPDGDGDDSGDDSGDEGTDASNGSGDDDNSGDNDPDDDDLYIDLTPSHALNLFKRKTFGVHRRLARRKRTTFPHHNIVEDPAAAIVDGKGHPSPAGYARDLKRAFPLDIVPSVLPLPAESTEPPLPTMPTPSIAGGDTSSSYGTISGTLTPAQAPAKTQQCTPSPTTSMAPSATWTTCPYEVRDGKVNPDVRTLPDSPSMVSMSESVVLNAIAFALGKTLKYSQNAASFVDTFFLSPATAMHPSMNFGQLVRGPGQDHQVGTFTGILDLRGLVKVVNAIEVLKATRSPDWTPTRDKEMLDWMNQYISWLTTSALGKETAGKPNNHGSFYVNQLAAAKIFVGDTNGAIAVLQHYFNTQFLDQVAGSGEQPFEAIRTRPYHYRCFNLEAMITNAKLGDQLGQNFWTSQSRYGATVQTALDYVMAIDPKDEDVSDIFPHVAAVLAAYGDRNGKYRAFLAQKASAYKSSPYYFYDQTPALPNAPASTLHRRDGVITGSALHMATEGLSSTVDGVRYVSEVPFECPAIFSSTAEVEIEDGIYVTCNQLEPYYKLLFPGVVSA